MVKDQKRKHNRLIFTLATTDTGCLLKTVGTGIVSPWSNDQACINQNIVFEAQYAAPFG